MTMCCIRSSSCGVGKMGEGNGAQDFFVGIEREKGGGGLTPARGDDPGEGRYSKKNK